MRAYIIRRLLLLVPTLFIVTMLTFLSVRFIPGDAIDAMAAQLESLGLVVDREALEHKLGLDVPVYVQYGRWMGGILLHGTLGESLWGGDVSIEEKILGRLPVTLELGVMAVLIGLVIAVPVGIYSAIRRNSAADYVGRTAAVIGLATPNFWLALMVIIFPAIWWGWSPPMRLVAFTEDPLGNLGVFIIPSLILGTAASAGTMRLTRTMMLEALRQDYIRPLDQAVLTAGLISPVSAGHPGIDKPLHRVIYGARLSIAVGLAATSLNVVVARLAAEDRPPGVVGVQQRRRIAAAVASQGTPQIALIGAPAPAMLQQPVAAAWRWRRFGQDPMKEQQQLFQLRQTVGGNQ